jgi:purine-binding chemotaxis protein CheW
MNQWEYSVEETEILEQRAKKLATALQSTKRRKEISHVAVVTVGKEHFGIPVKSLVEVIKTPLITGVPELPDWIRGIVQVRGQLMTVIDLARWFRISTSSRCEFLAIVNGPPGLLGLQIETTEGFRTVYADEVVQTLQISESTTSRPFRATTRDLLTLLDITRLFSSQQIILGAGE